ncbi:MAG: hypothetical protein QNJ97_01835 [Myxococcota bacterium]|nr:hypothetical protein [Myxococcota bacterium]
MISFSNKTGLSVCLIPMLAMALYPLAAEAHSSPDDVDGRKDQIPPLKKGVRGILSAPVSSGKDEIPPPPFGKGGASLAIPRRTSMTDPPLIDVDARLKLAHQLAHEGAFGPAETHALAVIQQAPTYWDAYLLLARLNGWQKKYDKALEYIDVVTEKAPEYRGARLLKLDILIWSGNIPAAEALANSLIASGNESADIYYRRAQLARARLRYLSAYRLARTALKIDPFHQPAKQLVRDTRIVTVYLSNEFEVFSFPQDESTGTPTDTERQYGYGLSITGQAWSRARFSVLVLNTFRSRYETLNNQLGLGLIFRPTLTTDLVLRGTIGVPARVVPKKTLHFSARQMVAKRLDFELSYTLDQLPWPQQDTAVLQRPKVGAGVQLIDQIRLGAAYHMGLLSYCDKPVHVSHSGMVHGQWMGQKISVKAYYGYGEEHDKSDTGVVAPSTCAELAAFEAQYQNTRFGIIGIDIHSMGMQVSWQMARQYGLTGGYLLQLRRASSNTLTLPAHVFNLGGSFWY